MKNLLAAVASAALLGFSVISNAGTVDIKYTGAVVPFDVPATGVYQIIAAGAQGGDAVCNVPNFCSGLSGIGGEGALISGFFVLRSGEPLQIAVGGQGGTVSPSTVPGAAGGGGGGTFVVGPNKTPLVIAGGGGGGGTSLGNFFEAFPGGGGLATTSGSSTGTNGQGGLRSVLGPSGGAGAGFLTAGEDGNEPATGGGTFPGLAGGTYGNAAAGGFGGGGAGGNNGAGGGGGYSGGDAGGERVPLLGAGAGGGSFNAGFAQVLVGSFKSGDGEVIISGPLTARDLSFRQ